MRNLKKVLSLSLALVMLMGMMVVSAGAATDYTDANDISYNEAVDVMSAVGVFSGSDKGDFQPNGELTREQAAKIITYMLMGQSAADKLSTNTAPFKDVPANKWSAGSIAYCVTLGIIAGDGNGNFYPTQTVNGYAFAKMLLVALGYDATIETYTGTNWAINVASRAAEIELDKGLDISLANTLTREQACQMAFNAIKADTVKYASKGTNITINGVTIAQGASDAESTGKVFFETYLKGLEMNKESFDAFGRPATSWSFEDEAIGDYAQTASKTFTADTKDTDIAKTLRGYTYADQVNVTTNNKIEQKAKDDMTAVYVAGLTGNGTVVEIYADKKVITDVVVVETTYTEVSKIDTKKEEITLKGGAVVAKEDQPELYAVLADLEKGDKVLAAIDGNNSKAVLSVDIPETVTGKFTKLSGGKYTVGGEVYEKAEAAASNILTSVDGNTYTLTLDQYGYIVDAKLGTEAESNYAYALESSRDGSAKAGYTYNLKLLYTDGTVEWVEVDQYDGQDAEEKKDDFTGNKLAGFVTYAENTDGTVNVKPVATGLTSTELTTGAIKKGDSDSLASYTLSSKTVFLIKTGDVFKSYTGIKNVPDTSIKSGYVLKTDASGDVARIVLLLESDASASKDVVYIYDDSVKATEMIGNKTVYYYNAIVNGEATQVVSEKSSVTIGLYNAVVYNGDGQIKEFGAAVSEPGNDKLVLGSYTATAKLENDVLTMADGSTHTVDEFTAYYVDATETGKIKEAETADIDKDGDNTGVTYGANDKFILIYDEDGAFVNTLIIINNKD